MMDLNDPPFDKDSDFSKKAEEVVATLATAENLEIRQAVARCIYTSRDTLMRLKDDETKNIKAVQDDLKTYSEFIKWINNL